MLFCPKCKSILMPKPDKGKTVLKCSCGYSAEGNVKLAEKTVKPKSEPEVGVVEHEPDIHAKTEADCTKCGNKEAFAWEVQTRAADEAATRFFRCTKCKHTWREYR